MEKEFHELILFLTKEIIKSDDAVEKLIMFNHEVGNANSNTDEIMEEVRQNL